MEGYMTIKQAAEKWNITTRRIQFLCSKGRIEGATKFGRDRLRSASALNLMLSRKKQYRR